MADIIVSLDKWLEGQTTSPSILTRVYPLDAPEKPHAMMIPAGPSDRGERVSLPAGKYLFEAYLPNGDVASETVTVHDGANPPVRLRATDSPHEWLSWQHLAGYTPTWTKRPGTDAAAQPVHLGVVTTEHPPETFARVLLEVWKDGSLAKLRLKPLNVDPRPGSNAPLVDAQLSVTSYLYDNGPWRDGVRYYGHVAQPPAGPPLLAVLPVPWYQADHSGHSLVDVIVDAHEARSKKREWPVRVSVVVRDNVMASVFGYLASGDLPAAGRVAETAVELLYYKGENPLAAAGGAYALVRLPIDRKRPPAWVPWLRNLRNRFPWLPDGAILDGWADLNGIGREVNVTGAATAFITAAQRGVPYYSSGVKLLFEGLTRLDSTMKPGARPDGFGEAFEFARRMALRVDLRQPFTVVRLA